MIICGIDPGTEKSAIIFWDSEKEIVRGNKLLVNKAMLLELVSQPYDRFAIEMVASYGMSVGREVFETVFWIGQFWRQVKITCLGDEYMHRIERKDVKIHFCNSMKAKDGNIRQALIDRFGGSKEKAIGKKKAPGPLYGVHVHAWPALAVAVMASDIYGRRDNGDE